MINESDIQTLVNDYSNEFKMDVTLESISDDVLNVFKDEAKVRCVNLKVKSKTDNSVVLSLNATGWYLSHYLLYMKGFFTAGQVLVKKQKEQKEQREEKQMQLELSEEDEDSKSSLPDIDNLLDKRMC